MIVRRLFQRFSVNIDDVKVQVLKSRHSDWTGNIHKDSTTYDELLEKSDQIERLIVVSCYQGFDDFPNTHPRNMAAGNIKKIANNNFTIKTPKGELEIKGDNPSSYRLFRENKKPSDISGGKVSDNDWFISSLVWGFNFSLQI